MMVALAQRIQDGNHKQQGLFDSVVGQLKTYEKRWVVDIDTKDKSFVEDVATFINTKCRPVQDKIISIIPTKNGYHLITDRFDVKTFKEMYPELEIQKKNPTLLFLPNSLN
jgi:hypothetical protein